MITASYAREADRVADDEATREPKSIDFTAVEGDWISTTGLAGGVSRLRCRERDRSLVVGASGYGEPRPGNWGEVRADGAFANAVQSNAAMAFIATFDGPQVRSQLHSYLAIGVLTGHTFHRFADGSGRRDYFTREFYVLAEGGQPPAAGDFPAALRSGRNDPSRLLGTWRGLAPAAYKSISTLECDLVDGDLAVRAYGVGVDGAVDWGVTPAQLYADAAYPDYPPAFLATFDHGYMRVHLQARINRGVLVVCEFTEFTDGSGRSDYFIREGYRN